MKPTSSSTSRCSSCSAWSTRRRCRASSRGSVAARARPRLRPHADHQRTSAGGDGADHHGARGRQRRCSRAAGHSPVVRRSVVERACGALRRREQPRDRRARERPDEGRSRRASHVGRVLGRVRRIHARVLLLRPAGSGHASRRAEVADAARLHAGALSRARGLLDGCHPVRVPAATSSSGASP